MMLLKRQPESTTEELEDGHPDNNADMKTLGAVREEPWITVGLNGETLAECDADEMQESRRHQIWSEMGELAGFCEMPCVTVSQLVSMVLAKKVKKKQHWKQSANLIGSAPLLKQFSV